MIAARPFQDLTRGLGRNAFDLPVAALAGLAAAFLAFAIPADLLGQAVIATGLPHLLAAAEPPLGFKARAMIGTAGAFTAFGLAYVLLRLLDGAGRGKAKAERELELEDDMPRLRRRDFHPDAPARKPICAARDFGEPAPPPQGPARAAPTWFAEAHPELVEREPAPPVEPESTLELEHEAQLEPELAPEPAPTPAPAAEASLADLMRRLEQGLARRRTRQVFAPTPHQHAPAPQVFPEAGDDRLQNAIESLQRFAARGD